MNPFLVPKSWPHVNRKKCPPDPPDFSSVVRHTPSEPRQSLCGAATIGRCAWLPLTVCLGSSARPLARPSTDKVRLRRWTARHLPSHSLARPRQPQRSGSAATFGRRESESGRGERASGHPESVRALADPAARVGASSRARPHARTPARPSSSERWRSGCLVCAAINTQSRIGLERIRAIGEPTTNEGTIDDNSKPHPKPSYTH